MNLLLQTQSKFECELSRKLLGFPSKGKERQYNAWQFQRRRQIAMIASCVLFLAEMSGLVWNTGSHALIGGRIQFFSVILAGLCVAASWSQRISSKRMLSQMIYTTASVYRLSRTLVYTYSCVRDVQLHSLTCPGKQFCYASIPFLIIALLK